MLANVVVASVVTGFPTADARRREASWTAVSTTVSSTQRDDTNFPFRGWVSLSVID
jgi:hypothetical protein